MDPLTVAVGTALISAMATDGWQQARESVVRLWRRARPEDAPAIGVRLDEVRGEVVAARQSGDEQAERDLATGWQRELQALVAADPRIRAGLERLLSEELNPLLPGSERRQVYGVQQNVTASGYGVAQGTVYGDISNSGYPGRPAAPKETDAGERER